MDAARYPLESTLGSCRHLSPTPVLPTQQEPNPQASHLPMVDINLLCESLMQRLLPSIQDAIEEAADRAAQLAVKSAFESREGRAGSSVCQGSTHVGVLQPGSALTVDWTFTNKGDEPWPIGTGLRFLSGTLAPPPSTEIATATEMTPQGADLTVHATMKAPMLGGPCDGYWQLESAPGVSFSTPLSPPIYVQGAVSGAVSVPCATSLEPSMGSMSVPRSASMPRLRSETILRSPMMRSRGGDAYPQSQQPQMQRQFSQLPQTQQVQQVQQPGSGINVDVVAWRQAFEEFFGMQTFMGLRQDAEKERNRMVNQIWEYSRAGGYTSSNALNFDPKLKQIFAPWLWPEQTSCKLTSLLNLVHQVAARYQQICTAGRS